MDQAVSPTRLKESQNHPRFIRLWRQETTICDILNDLLDVVDAECLPDNLAS